MAKKPLLTRKMRLGDLAIPAASGRVQFPIDTARNVHGVHMHWTIAGVAATEAEMKAQIGTVRVWVGGKRIWELTATQILDLYHYYHDKDGVLTFAGQLPLIFTPAMLPLNEATKGYALGMLSDRDQSKRNTFVVEVNMTAGPITVDGCEVQLEYDDEKPASIGYHVRWIPYGTTWAAISRQTLDQIAHETNALAVLGYHIPTTGTITRVEHTINDADIISDLPVDLINLDLNRAGRSPVASYYHLDYALKNDPIAFLDISQLVNEYLRLTWSVAPTGYNILVQQLCLNL
jgi:hypothetical protein